MVGSTLRRLKLKLVILANYSQKVGHGHLSRCLPIGKYLIEKGSDVWVTLFKENEGLEESLKEEGFKTFNIGVKTDESIFSVLKNTDLTIDALLIDDYTIAPETIDKLKIRIPITTYYYIKNIY